MKTISIVLAVLMGAITLCSAATPPPPAATTPTATTPPETAQVTQIELAKLIVELAHLSRFLPPNPSDADYFAVLMANNIAPEKGWSSDQAVSRYDLARVCVLALKQGASVAQPDNPQSWIDYLVDKGYRIDTIGLATKPLAPLALPVGPTMYPTSGQLMPRVVPSGDVQFGAVMQPVREFFKPTSSTATSSNSGVRI